MTRRRLYAIAGVIALVIGEAVLFAGPARAASIAPEAQGWWSEAQQAPAPLPVNTVTGQNLQVGGDPTGPNAIAAMRYIVPGTIDGAPVDPASVAATLTLKVVPNTGVGTAAVVVCPVNGGWVPASGGAWAARPGYTCAKSAPGTLSADKATMTFKLDPSLQVQSGIYDIAVVPDPKNQAPFSVQFQPPAEDSLSLGPGTPAEGAGNDVGGAAVSSSDSTAPLAGDTTALAPVGGPSSFDVGSGSPLSSPPAVQSPHAGRVAAGVAPNRLLPGPLRRAVATKRSQQAIALGVLAAIAVALWWFGGQQARAPRLLGSLGDGRDVDVDGPPLYVRTGGIGRFARPRTKPPARL